MMGQKVGGCSYQFVTKDGSTNPANVKNTYYRHGSILKALRELPDAGKYYSCHGCHAFPAIYAFQRENVSTQ